MLGAGTELGTVNGNDWEMKPIAPLSLLRELAGNMCRIVCARLRLVEQSRLFSDSISACLQLYHLGFTAAAVLRSLRKMNSILHTTLIGQSHDRAVLTYAKGVTPFSGCDLSSANPISNRGDTEADSRF